MLQYSGSRGAMYEPARKQTTTQIPSNIVYPSTLQVSQSRDVWQYYSVLEKASISQAAATNNQRREISLYKMPPVMKE